MPIEQYPCPWCNEPYEIDTSSADAAIGFECPHCHEPSALGVLRNPSRHPQAVLINAEASAAISEHVHRFTVFTVRTSADGVPKKGFTSVLVNVGERTFFLTAGHCIENVDASRIAFVSKLPTVRRLVRPTIENLIHQYSDGIDAGAIEVSGSDELGHLGAEVLPVERISDVGAGDPLRAAKIAGFPESYKVRDVERQILGVAGLSLGSMPVSPELWPQVSRETRNAEPDKHIVLQFARSGVWYSKKFHPDIDKLGDQPPEPFGMSGGGIWQSPKPANENAVWSAGNMRLIGIQAMWPRHGRFLRATQAVHWVRLISDNYPDLRSHLQSLFSRV